MSKSESPNTSQRTLYERVPSELVTHPWKMVHTDWNPEKQPLREALCTLGNGYFATRGAFEEVCAGGPHYPGTYLAGGYNRLESEVSGRVIENEDLVNWPNWLPLTFRPKGGEWFDLSRVELLEFRQTLDIGRGILERFIRFRDEGRTSSLRTRRFVHMADAHLAAIHWELIPEDWSGAVEFHSALDGRVKNEGVRRYRQLNNQHLNPLEDGVVGEDGIYLVVETNQSHIRMTQAARTQIFSGDDLAPSQRRTSHEPGRIAQTIECPCERKKPLRVEKIVSVYTSRDRAISNSTTAAHNAVRRAGRFETLLEEHALQWKQLWRRCDLTLTGDEHMQFVLRLHIFHLLQTASLKTIDLDISIPSRGWHGEAYRGHIFWDELFIFPFINLRIPELTRALLMYRFRRLPEARCIAEAAGYQGAMFPWQSGGDGREESQVIHLNPRSGRWVPDDTYRQRHVNAGIAYNVWQYYQATNDLEFLSFYGAEIVLAIARFWASIATYNAQRDRYEIREVVGPDEFHTSYPDKDQPGLNNNAYTNVMASWVLQCAQKVLNRIDEPRRKHLQRSLRISDVELASWSEVAAKMFVPFHEGEIISQFEGYEKLQEFDWEGYRQKYGDVGRLDRILESEGDDVNRYKASKQADVLMLFYLFSTEELQTIFERMRYPFRPEIVPKNVHYYLQRTSHGSTLSQVVHSWVLARTDRERSWHLFGQALETDVADIQGGTTPEGIHLGAMAGTVDLIQRAYTGVEVRDDVLWFNPCLPDSLSDLHMRLRYRAHWIDVYVTKESLRVSLERAWPRPARIGFRGQVFDIEEGQTLTFDLNRDE